ncbi:uncharacterized protein PGTG_17642 [Puccinia graminis f. sp. tritici CRL 75-36-700-3]|uniref:Sugar phosphate transporter domain-containing protein n=1 Tax=Puccinia graminis f. sp. tritici (strain CRL 75-36-700-3 / race SCCL) TaxID=418459 RepID=E3L4W3_PUCGT|nr:uncharacterized protein PGTG_17642 [Puccinia graminis f. sp. tritici CRL 75-36-700-3]EFP91588.1 hypothetical protein PGTG_17642 [Puccinia graminis f. sp. tritici CRL 75-36-700-3]
MLDWNKPKSSFDEQSELPLYNKNYSRQISSSHSIGLTSRSTSLSPTANFTNLPPTYSDTQSSTHEKISLCSRQPAKKPHGDGITETVEGSPSKWKVAAVIIFYLVAAIVMVFANKWVLRTTAIPITFLFCQLLLATGLLKLAGLLGFLEIPNLDLKIGQKLLPLISINVIGLVFNTFCLQYVDASFYQIARGLVLPFTVLASYLFLDSRPSPNILSTVLIVCVGFLWGVQSDHLHTSRIGVALGVLSSITTSVHAIVVKRSLSVTSSAIELSYYNNLVSAIFLLPLIPLTSEIVTFRALLSTGGQDLHTFLMGALVTGFFGFLISLAGFLSIKITSPVTHMVSSAVRGVLQTILGTVLFGDLISSNRFIGIVVILGGSIAYTAIKDKESRSEKYHLTTRSRPSQPILPIVSPSKNPINLTALKVVC